MEHHQQRSGAALNLTGVPANQWKSKDRPLEECRTLVRSLARKTENLYRNGRSEQEKMRQIQAMGSTLAALTVLLNRLHRESGITQAIDIFTDGQEVTYQSVRSCDLDRISDK